MILDHAPWLLFGWVFVNQAGLPAPVVPALIGAGALAGSGSLSLTIIMLVVVAASLAADLTWYALGRWRGALVLKTIARLTPRARLLVRRAQRLFSAHLGAFQLGARFLPELNAITAGLAGAKGVRSTRFIGYGALSALAWGSAWIGLGYLVSHAVMATAALLGVRLIVLFLGAFAIYLPFQRARRHHLIQAFRRTRPGAVPDEVQLEGPVARPSWRCAHPRGAERIPSRGSQVHHHV